MGASRSSLARSLLALVALAPTPLFGAATLDVSTSYKLRALDYRNIDVTGPRSDRSFMSQNAQLGFAVKNIELTNGPGEPVTMDMALSLRAVGVTGSTGALAAPFDAIAAHYPNAQFIPFIDNAYLRTRGLFGYPVDLTVGQQSYTVGSGLLLADDGVGLPGISARGALPWGDLKLDGYVFQPRNAPFSAGGLTDSLMIYGASLEAPSEGTWKFNQMFERELGSQLVELGQPVSKAMRSFSSVHYQISSGPLFFDGEAALEKGSATGSPAGRIAFNGNAQVLKAKWKQAMRRGGQEGIARITAARGSGDNPTTTGADEAFFPSRGHRFDGLERSGFGELFQATPYDAFGGHSSATATGLPGGASGIISVGLGYTPPAYKGISVDFDYWLFQADRNLGPYRSLGRETDIRARYGYRERFNIILSAALFTAGNAVSPAKPSARRYMLEFAGRF